MAAPIYNSSAYALPMAYALILVSLWNVDLGLAGPSLSLASADNTPVAVNFSPVKALHNSAPVASNSFPFVDRAASRAEAENTELRRLATVALVVYATGDGIKR